MRPRPEIVAVIIDGVTVSTTSDTSVAAAILDAGIPGFRKSVTGERRGPLCGMGICFECRVTIGGAPHSRSCQIMCREGMEIVTGA